MPYDDDRPLLREVRDQLADLRREQAREHVDLMNQLAWLIGLLSFGMTVFFVFWLAPLPWG